MRTTSLLLLVLALVAAACGGTDPGAASATTATPTTTEPAPGGEFDGLALELVADGLSIPVAATAPPGDDRIFVIEQTGTVRIIDETGVVAEPYLDLTRFIEDEGLEQGLLSLAFHPDFADNGRVFVSFTNTEGDNRIVEYRQDPTDPDRLDFTTGRRILAIDQPHEYHNGGTLHFGPDGNLWVGIGDGGGIGDPWRNGQNPHSLPGTMLRIDVDGGRPYAIPDDNPFADGVDGAPEVWAYGLRNPWTFSFTDEGEIVIAEVGHEVWEEIIVADIDSGGANYGWPVVEGPDCFEAETCDADGFVPADLLVKHERACAIVGGPVYRGAAIPELHGEYFYGDFCVGWVRSARWDGDRFLQPTEWSRQFGEIPQTTALAEDGHGEILLLTREGAVFRIVAERS